jgi:hypothetical protein
MQRKATPFSRLVSRKAIFYATDTQNPALVISGAIPFFIKGDLVTLQREPVVAMSPSYS